MFARSESALADSDLAHNRNLLRQIPVLRRASVVADRACRGLRVELVRVVQDGRFGGLGGGAVVMTGHGVQQLRKNGRVEIASSLLDHPKPEMDVAEEAALVGLSERRPGPELADPAHVVEERGREDDVVAQSRVELRRLAAECRDAHGVLEEATRVPVVPVR